VNRKLNEFPLYAAQLDGFMSGGTNAETCLKRSESSVLAPDFQKICTRCSDMLGLPIYKNAVTQSVATTSGQHSQET
jgi:hypothetical protein